MRILMGVDDSKFAGALVQVVATQFQAESSEVLVLHVVQTVGPAPPQMDAAYAPELEEEKAEAEALVERVANELHASGFKAVPKVVLGDVKERIIDFAVEWRPDLIVVGSHGQRGIQRFLLGSVSEFVARHAKCSVEIVRTPGRV